MTQKGPGTIHECQGHNMATPVRPHASAATVTHHIENTSFRFHSLLLHAISHSVPLHWAAVFCTARYFIACTCVYTYIHTHIYAHFSIRILCISVMCYLVSVKRVASMITNVVINSKNLYRRESIWLPKLLLPGC